MDKDTSSPGILHRGAFIYYVGSVVFAAGIALLAVGTAFVMIFRIHHGSEPEKIILCLIFTGVGTTLILTGINLMMRQTQYGYYIVGASAFISVLALLLFTSSYPHNWYYPLISYILALYVIGFLMLLGNAFANVILWMIEGKTEAVVGREGEIKLYTDEEIERDIEEATRKSIELSARKLEFKEPGVEGVRLGKVFRETRGNTTRVKDDMVEAKSLRKTIRPGERMKSGSTEVEGISRSLGDILRKSAVEKGRFGRIEDKIKAEVKKFYSFIGVNRK
jgi:hypothetical protein